jgi:hypothetical protein
MATVKIDDPSNPLVAAFGGKSFVHQDEFLPFRRAAAVARQRARADEHGHRRTDLNQGGAARARASAPTPTTRSAGSALTAKGASFFTALGHTPAFFFAAANLNDFFFRGLQFVLGDLDADTTPSAKVRK